ncbi:MAG: C-GCAxxG-C-C family protein [Oscillospiraceae bacterium]|nr:C-GCAxxG-C-C family protein [Oscillospiraceae bacterium]
MKADTKRIAELHASGFSCAQVVAYMCRDLSGIDEKAALAAMGGFGGGLRCGEVCGAVAAGVYTLGLCFPYNEPGDAEAKENIAALTREFTEKCKEEFGALPCRELIADGSHERCEGYMARAVELIHEMIEREKTNGNL